MLLKIDYMTDAGVQPLQIEIDDDTKVGDVARRLAGGRTGRMSTSAEGDLGLIINPHRSDRRVVPPLLGIGAAGIMSGDSVAVTGARLPSAAIASRGMLHIIDGPDRGAEFTLTDGGNTIGRGDEQSIGLKDPLVGVRHATITIDDRVEIRDNGSASGITVNDRNVMRTILRSGDRIRLGHTEAKITLDAAAPSQQSGNRIEFNRSPRLDPAVTPSRLIAPEPPTPPSNRRFPVISLIGPLMMGAVMIAMFRSTYFLMFMVFGPVMVVGSWWEQRRANRLQLAADTARFRTALADFETQLEYATELERAARLRRHPAVSEVLEATADRSMLVWTRRRDHDTMGQVRLGLGTQSSLHDIVVTQRNNTAPELWHELNDLVNRYRTIDGVPVVVGLDEVTNIGIAGPSSMVDAYVRGLVAQWTVLHAPVDLTIGAIADEGKWFWLTWLPHIGTSVSPLEGVHLAADGASVAALTAQLERLVDDRCGDDPLAENLPTWPRVVILVDDNAPIARQRLIALAEIGPTVGVHLVWMAPSVARLPAACRTFVELHAANGLATVGRTVDGEAVPAVRFEPVTATQVANLARQIAPLVDSGAANGRASALPAAVDLVDMIGTEVLSEPTAVLGRWLSNKPGGGVDSGGLRAVIGSGIDGPTALDLRRDGPHALVGGTTGAGKSEFLQTWILSMAVNHGPDRLNFLLIDYKGGAAFAECVGLTHCVGLVTDLSPHMVRRALISLRSELRRRERLLNDKGAKDLIELEKRGDRDCPASLVIVVDEFAALLAEVPEFVEGVVDVAQRGRSLGLHLILATQRPAGVITDQVRANTNLRIALRMADVADSKDVIGSRLAAEFPIDRPGRVAIRSGPSRVVTSQVAYVGGSGAETSVIPAVMPLGFGLMEEWPRPIAHDDGGCPHIARIAENIRVATGLATISEPRRPWLAPLAESYDLAALAEPESDCQVFFGLGDVPHEQIQTAVAFRPDRDGNLIIVGSGGSGKSTALRVFAEAAALAIDLGGVGPTNNEFTEIYGIDAAGRGLLPLEILANVGSIIDGDDSERVGRLLSRLANIIDDRAERFARLAVGNLPDYRRWVGEQAAPSPDDRAACRRIIVLIDDVGTFRETYEGMIGSVTWARFVRIVAEGRGVGVHVVMSADRPSAPSSAVASHIRRRLILRLDNEIDLAMTDVPRGGFASEVPPGRGFIDKTEVQVAALGATRGLLDEQMALRQLADRVAAVLNENAIEAPLPIARLSEDVALVDLPVAIDGWPTIGVAGDTLAPCAIEPTGTFLITGPPHSGISTALETIVTSIGRWAGEHGRFDLVHLAPGPSELCGAIEWAAEAIGAADTAALATELTTQIPTHRRRVGIVVQRPSDFVGTNADSPLVQLIRVVREHGGFIVAEQEMSGMSSAWPLLAALRAERRGLLMQPDMMDGDHIFKTPIGRVRRRDFPIGRGMLVMRGAARVVQIAR